MSVTRDVNLGTVVPIALFLLVQSIGGVWWAASVNASVEQMQGAIASGAEDLKAEQLRQWTRINALELASQQSVTAFQTLGVSLAGVKESLNELRYDLRQNNDLLRQAIIDGSVKAAK